LFSRPQKIDSQHPVQDFWFLPNGFSLFVLLLHYASSNTGYAINKKVAVKRIYPHQLTLFPSKKPKTTFSIAPKQAQNRKTSVNWDYANKQESSSFR
jgi:hypothetical protein